MKPILLLWFLLADGLGLVPAQRVTPASTKARTVALYARSEARVPTITFVTVPDGATVHSVGADEGTLNLGIVSNATRDNVNGVRIQSRKDSFVMSTRIGVRVDLSNSSHAGTATLSAYLVNSDPWRTVWMDGVQLSIMPAIIGRPVQYGATTQHAVRILVPAAMPAGQVLDLIGMTVTAN